MCSGVSHLFLGELRSLFSTYIYWSGFSKPFATWQAWVINQELNYTKVSIRAFKTTDIPICAMLKIIGSLFSFSSFIHHILIGRSREWFCKIFKLCFGLSWRALTQSLLTMSFQTWHNEVLLGLFMAFCTMLRCYIQQYLTCSFLGTAREKVLIDFQKQVIYFRI